MTQLSRAGQWARNNAFASRQWQRDNVTEPQEPVRDQKKLEKYLGLDVKMG